MSTSSLAMLEIVLVAALLGLTQGKQSPALPCDTCQIICHDLAKRVAELPKSAYLGQKEAQVMDMLEEACSFMTLRPFAAKFDYMPEELVEACKEIMEDAEEQLEVLLPKGMAGAELRERVCLEGALCKKLWSDAEMPENRESAEDRNARESKAFLDENAKAEGVTVLASGLQYKVIKKGAGDLHPSRTDTVTVHYRGTLKDGTEFDSSYSRGTPATFGVSGVIAGWTEALQLMVTGDVWELYIPPDLGYGVAGSGSKIGPNSALVFKVELLSIKGKDEKSQTPKPTARTEL